jgi:hypothetical protein
VPNKKLFLVATLTAVACAHPSAPKPETPESVAQPAPQTVAPPQPPPPEGVEEPVASPVRDDDTIVISPGGHQKPVAPRLGQIAEAERERRATAAPPILVVDDKTLAAHATGSLTESKPNAKPPAAAAQGPNEGYWRDRVRTLRTEWAAAVDAIQELEERAVQLRTRFYATDDPYVRDAQVKPAWDQTLGNLDAAKRRAAEIEQRLADALEEGRVAGALPGWLRDGIDLEPKARPYEPPARRVRPGEPADGELAIEPDELDEG